MALKEKRIEAGITQQALAEKAKLAIATVQRIEQNPEKGRAVTLQKIAKALGCTIEELL